MTQVAQVMTRSVRSLSPQDTIAAAARTMQQLDVGVVPVCEAQRLVGLVTDRDLVIRGIAEGRDAASTPLGQVMSLDLRWCRADQSIDEVLEQMRDSRVRRVPVLDEAHRLVGMLSLGDLALRADADGAGIVLQEISEPGHPSATDEAPQAAAADAPTGDGADTGPSPSKSDDGAGLGLPPRTLDKTTWVVVADEAIARILQPQREEE